jgi:hypothetical protein
MFRRRRDLQIPRVIPLHSAHHLRSQQPRQRGRLSERLLRASPSRVAHNVDLRREAREPEWRRASSVGKLPVGPSSFKQVSQSSCLSSNHVADCSEKVLVPRRREGDGLREHGGVDVAGAVPWCCVRLRKRISHCEHNDYTKEEGVNTRHRAKGGRHLARTCHRPSVPVAVTTFTPELPCG